MKNPAAVIPEATDAIEALHKATYKGGPPSTTLELVHLRARQVNSCTWCVAPDVCNLKQKGEADEHLLEPLFAVAAWRDGLYFTDAEHAALALPEAVTRLADHSDPVPDAAWDEATKYYDERGMAALILWIATTNALQSLQRNNAASRR